MGEGTPAEIAKAENLIKADPVIRVRHAFFNALQDTGHTSDDAMGMAKELKLGSSDFVAKLRKDAGIHDAPEWDKGHPILARIAAKLMQLDTATDTEVLFNGKMHESTQTFSKQLATEIQSLGRIPNDEIPESDVLKDKIVNIHVDTVDKSPHNFPRLPLELKAMGVKDLPEGFENWKSTDLSTYINKSIPIIDVMREKNKYDKSKAYCLDFGRGHLTVSLPTQTEGVRAILQFDGNFNWKVMIGMTGKPLQDALQLHTVTSQPAVPAL